VFVDRFRPPSAKSNNFFLRFGSGNAIVNPTNELDSLQHDFNLPFICSSNARHVVETLKGNAGLDATSSARYCAIHISSAPFFLSRACTVVCDVSAACVNVCCVRAVLTEGTAVGDMEIDTDTLDTGCALLWVYPIRS